MALDHNSPEYLVFFDAVGDGRTADIELYLAEHPDFIDLANYYGSKPLDW